MQSPLTTEALQRFDRDTLEALIEAAAETIEKKQAEGPGYQDNLFTLLDQKKVRVKEIEAAWGTSRQSWKRARLDLKKLTVERIYILAGLVDLAPVELFKIIINSYPQDEKGNYTLEAYRPSVQQALEDSVNYYDASEK